MKNSIIYLATIALSAAILMPGVSVAEQDYDSVNKSIRIDDGASVGSVESVNGSVRIGEGAVVKSIDSVNGAINLGKQARVELDVEAVNGTIKLAEGSEVGGNVETVNGKLRLNQSTVAGDVQTVNGDIILLSNSTVEGNITVRKPRGWSSDRKRPVKVEIGEGVRVNGDLIFEQPVELKIHNSASVGDVIGDEVTVIEG